MSCGRSVVISKTEGFWDTKNFKNRSTCFCEKNDLSGWISELNKIYDNDEIIEQIEHAGKVLVESSFTLKEFENKLVLYGLINNSN